MLTSTASSVGLTVIGAVLLAAVLHAVWNALAHAIDDQLAGFALIGTAVTVGGAAIVLASPAPSSASWPFLAASVALHVAYNLLLMRSLSTRGVRSGLSAGPGYLALAGGDRRCGLRR